ncbi:helix-turn-helix domain-containing protein [Flavobacterium sp. HSC-61S13]|uniref:helix-turn-helix domain-containing protein n=1 Tax=Flavobacterium sp. HSC-61S13 TaxID=2910963 RepID=UPI0020A1EDCF|nr:helix-turn-helix domain-containing protein [Flavobacterium sp. HSC-61S13]MCP1997379.1 AraC-like DNA-binding protein [Flavobacterium sp. HSC-61S13]
MEKNNYLITRKPTNELLKKHIAYYYFHASSNEMHRESFYFYPNYLHALTIYKGNDIVITSDKLNSQVRTSSDENKTTLLYTINVNNKIQVDIQGAFYKIGVVFYPMGINHFIDKPLNQWINQSFQEVALNEIFNSKIASLNKALAVHEQLEILETALLAVYRPFQENTLQKAIKEIILSNGTIKVEELEPLTAVSRKTLLRLFKKHSCTTIEEYKRVVMFRNSLNYALQHKELVNLTDVALYSMYYDQSHFIKHFKSITEESPKTLLPKIIQIGNEDLYWHFLEV